VRIAKWIMLAIAAIVVFGDTGAADGPYKYYIPIVVRRDIMSDWQIVIPEETTNKVLNPSAEAAGNFSSPGTVRATRSTDQQKFGLYSFYVYPDADNRGINLSTAALANAIHYVTMRVRGTLPPSWDWSVDNSNFYEPTLIEEIDEDWSLYGLQFAASECNGSTTLRVYQNGAGSGDFYLDGIQVEEKEYWTTYCDGSIDGCAWNSGAHKSASKRTSLSRAGGRVRDFTDDYDLDISGFLGAGTAPTTVIADSYAQLPGAQLNSITQSPRVFTLTGVLRGSGSWQDLTDKRNALIDVLAHDAVPKDHLGWQPIRLRYTGATVQKEISAHYEGGLDGSISADAPGYWERVAIRFFAPDPMFHAIGNSAMTLETEDDTVTYNYLAYRSAETGIWENLSSTLNSSTFASAVDEDGTFYVGGAFSVAGGAVGNFVAAWDGSSWSALGSGLNSTVYCLEIGPDGTLYAGGLFTTAGGSSANYIAAWDGSSWSALGSGMNGRVSAITFGLDGTLYASGYFTTAGGSSANYIASWNGSLWSALGSGMNSRTLSLAIGTDGTLYAGGHFTTAGGSSADYIAAWDGSSWTQVGSGLGGDALALVFGSDGTLYAGGIALGSSDNQLMAWNGSYWIELGAINNGNINAMAITRSDVIYLGGSFLDINDNLTLTDGLARYSRGSFSHLDINFLGLAEIKSISIREYEWTSNLDLFLVHNRSGGTTLQQGAITVTNDGNQSSYPRIKIKREGGSSATIATIRNNRTGDELLLNYPLLDGEELTIELETMRKMVTSSLFKRRLDAILPNSDFGEFSLLPGDNGITAFVIEDGSPTVTASIEWVPTYKSAD